MTDPANKRNERASAWHPGDADRTDESTALQPVDDYLDLERSQGNDTVGGLARVAATMWWHSASWALENSVHFSKRLVSAVVSPAAAAALAEDARSAAGGVLRELIEITRDDRLGPLAPAAEVAKRVADAVPGAPPGGDTEQDANGRPTDQMLREEGEELLRRSRDVYYEEEIHPAYERILSELAPDEGRIMRLLLLEGPQPAVDIRTGGPLGLVNSRLIAPGLSMIGARAGCRYVERVPAYLNNLFRLGMIWFSRETLSNPLAYQVLEAQPDVLEPIHSVRQAKVVRRSIHLTPFGEDFCRVCLLPEPGTTTALPPHSIPAHGDRGPNSPTGGPED